MENDYLNILAGIVLPSQILEYFSIVGIEQNSTEIHISLDEKMNPELSNDVHFESDLDIVARGTRYSKEFGAFLKETYGDVPGDLPYA